MFFAVFDDGRVICLKRTALCLKSGKYLTASIAIDQLHLTHPEYIGVTTVKITTVRGSRSRDNI